MSWIAAARADNREMRLDVATERAHDELDRERKSEAAVVRVQEARKPNLPASRSRRRRRR